VDGLETVNSERLLIATHQALLMESDIQKETYFSKEGVVKWQNSLAEDAVEARSTERLRKSGKRTRTAVDVEHNDVNRFFFQLQKYSDSLLLGGEDSWKKGYYVFDIFLLIFA